MTDEQQPADGQSQLEDIDIELNPVSEEQSGTARVLGQSNEQSLDDAFAAATEDAAHNVDLGMDNGPEIDETIWESFYTPNPHVTVASAPTVKKDLSKVSKALAAMRVGIDEAESIIKAHGLDDITEEQAEKLTAPERRLLNIIRSLSPVWQTSYFGESFNKGDWQQTVLHNDTELGTRRVKLDRVADPIIQIRNSLGQGALVQIPLWHTGIWITLRAPSNADLLDLDQQIRMEKATLGRYSNGMAFSNTEVYTTAAYAKFALKHMYAATYEFDTADHVEELLGIIKSTDFPQLMYGLLTAMYPDGYPFRQPCVANPLKCDYLDETILSIARLSYTDRDRLSAKQKRMMASRTAKLDKAGLAEYQAEFPFDNRAIKLNKQITAYLAVPTIADQIDAGYRWVDGIADATNRAFGLKLTEVDRYRHIVRAGMMTSLRQYSHWIERMEIRTNEGVDPTIVDDPIKKDEALEVVSGDKAALQLLDENIMKWIDNCSVTVIGLPKSPCPKCQEAPSEELTKHPHLIPLDVGYVFFTLAGLKIKGIEDAADEA